ncbi:B12-binding domain-containing radical SAM protein [bacterium]|nr:B12-binding domain-containing radical SAM protein [bacterium]
MNVVQDFPIVLIGLFGIDFGIRYISSYLKSKGYPAYIILFNQLRYPVEFLNNDFFTGPILKHQICPKEDLQLLISLLKQLQPKLVGISVTSTTMRAAQRITSEIKKHLDAIVVWGGIHAIIAPDECIQYADIVCIGEGEFPMWELAEKLREKHSLTGIKNLWIKTDKGIEKNELRPLIEDLDSLPFPDFIEDGNKFLIDSSRIVENPHIMSCYSKNMYPIMTSRGCMFSCAFCCNSVIRESYKNKGSYLRRRSVKNVIEELGLAIRNQPISSIHFWDDVFTYDKDWIGEFSNRYLAEIGKVFSCYAHPNYTDKEVIIKLARSGLNSIWLGIQSASESLNRNVFARNQSNQDILDFAVTMKKLRITSRYDLISDNPYETEQDQDNNVDLLLNLPRPYRIVIYSLCYFPQTPLTKKALNEGLITMQDLEQNSSKALNNFYMFLPLSKNKRQLFWNCIKAMAVNQHFSKAIVLLCKRIGFFKKYPHLLVFLVYTYLQLFKAIGEKKPIISDTPILFSGRDLEKHFTFGKSKFLFVKEKLIFLFFPLNNIGSRKRFSLRITSKLKMDLPLQLSVIIVPLSANRTANRTVWGKIKFGIKANCQNVIYLDLVYPNLYFSSDGQKKNIKLFKKAKFEAGDGRLYVMMLMAHFPNTIGYKRVGSTLCNI